MRAVEQHGVAEDLRDLAVRLGRERIGGLVTIEARGFTELDLHELVIDERAIDRGDQARVEPALADLDDRLQLVRERAEMAALLSGQHRVITGDRSSRAPRSPSGTQR